MKHINYLLYSMILFSFFIISCEKDETKPEPIASFTMSKITAEVDETITFTNSSENASNYSWDFGDGSTSSVENPTHSYSNAGEFVISLTASGEGGTNTVKDTILVNPDIVGTWLFKINWPTIKYSDYPMEFLSDMTVEPIEIYLSGIYELEGNEIEIKILSSLNMNWMIYNGMVNGNEMSGTMVSQNTGSSGTWSAIKSE